MISNYNNPAPTGKKNINKWAMEDFGGFSSNIYPTTNEVFNTKGSFNIGSYSDPKADQLIAGLDHRQQHRRGDSGGVPT